MIKVKGIKELGKSELARSKAGAGCWDGVGNVIVLCDSYNQLRSQEEEDVFLIFSPNLQS